MILRSLTLENFGLYAGRTVFDLTPGEGPDGRRPIVLVGGRNGAGKTTFLEAVRLALYGPRALGARVGRSEYEAYLARRLHRSDEEVPKAASVALEFDYAEAGVVHRYSVRRDWSLTASSRVTEGLRLEKDGRLVDSVPRDEWHHFLQELIPPGVSQLFFFDGEKVQEMADAEDDSGQLVEAIRSLLGIELVSRLRTDVGYYLARHGRESRDGGGESLDAVVRDIEAVQQEIEGAVGEVAEAVTLKESQSRALEQARRRFVQEGGELAARRGELEAERDAIKRQFARAEAELRELANGLLPLAVAPRLSERFGAFIARRSRAGSGGVRERLAQDWARAVAAWREDPAAGREARWTKTHWLDLEALIHRLRDDGCPAGGQDGPILAELGDLEAAGRRLGAERRVAAERAAALADEMEGLDAGLSRAEGLLARADAAATSLLLEEVRAAEERVSATSAKLLAREEALRVLRYRLSQRERDRTRLLAGEAERALKHRQTALAGRVGAALADYEGRLMAHKVAQLEDEFVRCFREIARKDDLLGKVSIDPATFGVRLVGRHGHEVPKASLSAGERQIYAITMLWALARTSGRALPMIIDTPLARLDSEHRNRLVDRYFPAASHQTILLSTDTEVDEALLGKLSPNISHAYRLDYLGDLGRTVVRPGYFEDESPAAATEGARAVHKA